MTPAVTLVIVWIGCIAVGYHLDKYKGQPGAGLALTIMFWFFGPLILAFIPTLLRGGLCLPEQATDPWQELTVITLEKNKAPVMKSTG